MAKNLEDLSINNFLNYSIKRGLNRNVRKQNKNSKSGFSKSKRTDEN
jgi:hypothetical protein